ncbi:hypothetical protein TNCV_3196781 [Trichonephila clavipes]|nr:hypothetical protein TNCV_3196781 [Trichonephila clavipes]
MTPVEDPAIVFASAQLILLYLGTAAVAFPASRHALLAKDLVTWQAMVGRHILEDIVGRVAQYVDEHYPVDKWHLGDLIAWVAQSALKYRPRICELSKCLEGPLKMIVCPKKLLPTLSHLVKLLYAASTINAGSDRWPVRLQTRAVVISTETESIHH